MLERKISFFEKYNVYLFNILVFAILMLGHIIQQELLVLFSSLLVCVYIFFSKYEKSVEHLFFITAFSCLFYVQNKFIYFIFVCVYILKAFIENKNTIWAILFAVVLLAFNLFTRDTTQIVKLRNLIGLFLTIGIAFFSKGINKINVKNVMKHYILGFVLATIIGFFINSIPSIKNIMEIDSVWIDELSVNRFSGLVYDSNFFAYQNYIILAYLLLINKKVNVYNILLCIFLVVCGLMTLSKSYVLMLIFIIVLFMFKQIKSLKEFLRLIFFAVILLVTLTSVLNLLDYNFVEIVINRFVAGGSFADQTTGRVDIWKNYIDYIFGSDDFKLVFFGQGFNASLPIGIKSATHNFYLEILYHFGLVGFILYAAYYIYCFILMNKNKKLYEDYNYSAIVLLILLVGSFFLSTYTFEPFWINICISFMLCKNLTTN